MAEACCAGGPGAAKPFTLSSLKSQRCQRPAGDLSIGNLLASSAHPPPPPSRGFVSERAPLSVSSCTLRSGEGSVCCYGFKPSPIEEHTSDHGRTVALVSGLEPAR
ncbi:hypothetical protein AOXY_G32734 [Acipenser oxyrinchus oxyrinchus]|uniref:Uncharacterized protein n=1 Tax=Acipenser oxyrinchus oxyrinchus TaxID=40147 RepID=A0AAD8CGU3_ACIOX|nr:hypothetical protein AOXY_G32734 [Acipenser oxyrinchus oxyrinchus]